MGFSIEFIVSTAIAIALALLPSAWEAKVVLLLALLGLLAVAIVRLPLSARAKSGASVLTLVVVTLLAIPSVLDQYRADAVLTAYQDKRDLAAKYQAHDESLKRIVAQFDNLRRAQSLFDAFTSPNAELHAAINDREVTDMTTALVNIDAIASPMGSGLRILLGQNLFRVIYPVPMRITPAISFIGLPEEARATLIENSNLGFTVLFLPFSVPVEHFGLAASAEF